MKGLQAESRYVRLESMKKKVPKAIRDWMAKNGRKGGKAGKGSPARIAANKRTAQNRWRKLHPAPAEVMPEK